MSAGRSDTDPWEVIFSDVGFPECSIFKSTNRCSRFITHFGTQYTQQILAVDVQQRNYCWIDWILNIKKITIIIYLWWYCCKKRPHSSFPTVFKMEKSLSHQQCYPQREPAKYFSQREPLKFYRDLSIISQGRYLCGQGSTILSEISCVCYT